MDPARSVKVTLPDGEFLTACGFHLRVVCNTCRLDFSDSMPLGMRGSGGASQPPQGNSTPQVAVGKPQHQPTATAATRSPVGQTPGLPPQQATVQQREPKYGSYFPTRFSHPVVPVDALEPLRLFRPTRNRFINAEKPIEMLIFVDGSCPSNGLPDATGGCCFILGTGTFVKFRLETRGPDDQPYMATSNRAELRAALAALTYKDWSEEGFKSAVIATDSAYVAKGITDSARSWVENQWRGQRGRPVKNQDLWKALLLRIEDLYRGGQGCQVRFWRIARRWNTTADQGAKDGATLGARAPERYKDIRFEDVRVPTQC